MPAKFYTETVYKQYRYFGAWEPNKPIHLGDIGILQGHHFEYIDNLANLGISFKVRESDQVGQLDFVSDKQARITTKLAGEAAPEGIGLSKADAGFQVSFKAEKAVLIKVNEAKTLVIENQITLGQEIERRYQLSGNGVKWEKEWVVVTEVIQGASGTIIVSEDKEAEIKVKANVAIGQGELNLADTSLGFEVISGQSISAKAIAQKGITPLFKLKGIKKALPWQAGRFKTKSTLTPDDLVFEEIVPEVEATDVTTEATIAVQTKSISKVESKIWLFSVGINTYKSENIANLDGCVNDVQSLSSFLRKRLAIPKSQCRTIINEEATRAGIISNFRAHFQQLRDGDIAVFHYSGHGSWEYTHDAFVEAGLESVVGHNEVLVCHDSKLPGIYHIADKELRQLVSEVQYPAGASPKDIHFVCLFDCCHSGSMLRQERAQVKLRNIPGDEFGRPLGSYLDGFYEQQYLLHKKVQLPPINYIALSACSPNQSAVELPTGGLFTQGLINTLDTYARGSSFPSYGELYTMLHEMVKYQAYNEQTPYLEYTGKVNPTHSFLLQGEGENAAYSPLIKKDRAWQIAAGSLHGVPYHGWGELSIPIYEKVEGEELVGQAKIKEVGLESSTVFITFEEGYLPPTDKQLYVPVIGRKLPIEIRANALAQQAKESLVIDLEKQKYRERFDIQDNAAYTIAVDPKQYVLYRGEELLFGLSDTDVQARQYFLERLGRIAKWEQINALQAPELSMIDPREISLKLTYWDNENQKQEHLIAPDKDASIKNYQVPIEYDPVKKGRPYMIEVTNNTGTDLYFYLIHLDRKFGIYQKYEHYPKSVSAQDKAILYNSIAKRTGFGIGQPIVKETLDTFIVIASLEALTLPFLFAQASLGSEFGQVVAPSTLKGDGKTREDIEGDFNLARWTLKRMEVKVKLA
ncbi:MAG: caspase family protein [Saprospiraceae bacterium]